MKFNYFSLVSLLVALSVLSGLTSCVGSDNMIADDLSDSFEIIKTKYGVEETSGSVTKECAVISVSTADMLAVLEILQKNSLHTKSCIVESANGGYFEKGEKEYIKKVIMDEHYKPVTRSGGLLSDFVLRVELSFNIENNQVYYLGTDYLYDSGLFEWHANGLSLFPAKKSNGFTYEFESESFLFFNLSDRGNVTVKVPVLFKGQYDFESNKGTYNFELREHN